MIQFPQAYWFERLLLLDKLFLQQVFFLVCWKLNAWCALLLILSENRASCCITLQEV
jgi:hypothetical protein